VLTPRAGNAFLDQRGPLVSGRILVAERTSERVDVFTDPPAVVSKTIWSEIRPYSCTRRFRSPFIRLRVSAVVAETTRCRASFSNRSFSSAGRASTT
jgi:hypothetical protein